MTGTCNVFTAKITMLIRGEVNAEVELTLAGGEKIISITSNASCEALALAQGQDVTVLIQACAVLIAMPGTAKPRLSARNQLGGIVSELTRGAVSTAVALTLGGGNKIGAILTNDSAEQLGLREGVYADAVINPSAVILGITKRI